MGYVRTHWHAMLIGAAVLWVGERFVLPQIQNRMGG